MTKRYPPSKTDIDVWHDAMRSTQSLGQTKSDQTTKLRSTTREASAPIKPSLASSYQTPPTPSTNPLPSSNNDGSDQKHPFQPLPRLPLECGVMGDISRRTAQALHRGQIKPEQIIDLHGFPLHLARQYFIDQLAQIPPGQRCILVITGKGRRDDKWQLQGKIRRALSDWINQDGPRQQVLGFCQAAPDDGGQGAFYLWLRA